MLGSVTHSLLGVSVPQFPANIYLEWVRKMDACVHLLVIFFAKLIIMLYHFPSLLEQAY